MRDSKARDRSRRFRILARPCCGRGLSWRRGLIGCPLASAPPRFHARARGAARAPTARRPPFVQMPSTCLYRYSAGRCPNLTVGCECPAHHTALPVQQRCDSGLRPAPIGKSVRTPPGLKYTCFPKQRGPVRGTRESQPPPARTAGGVHRMCRRRSSESIPYPVYQSDPARPRHTVRIS